MYKNPAREIKLFDGTGRLLITEVAKSHARRISMMAAADQRQIDALARQHPQTVKAVLTLRGEDWVTFDVKNGVSQAR
jgi:hypothetical protein